MKERGLLTAFFTGHLVDTAISYVGFLLGWKEIGAFRDSFFFNLHQEEKILIVKMGVVAVMTGVYALSKDRDKQLMARASEKALLIGTIAVWGVQAWNILNVVGELTLKGK